MSTNLTVFLVGVPAVVFWLYGIWKGVMFPLQWKPGHIWARRGSAPVYFWVTSAFWGVLALGFLIMPLLSWTGLRS